MRGRWVNPPRNGEVARRRRDGGGPPFLLHCAKTIGRPPPSALRTATSQFRGGLTLLTLLLLPATAHAQAAIPGALDRAFGAMSGAQGPGLGLSLQLLLIMGLLTILPSLLLMMTSFTRILVVLSILRQALGLQQSPPNQVLVGLALFLSLFVMAPVL